MQKKRFNELEGLRGLAAVTVVLDHFIYAFYALAIAGASLVSLQHLRIEDNLYGNPIMVITSGTFAVSIFFVLSGFVLSIGFFTTGDINVVRKLAAKRYLRLMVPALASIILCYALIVIFGTDRLREAAQITGSNWLSGIWTIEPNFFEALKSGFFDIFYQSGNNYNGVLWTMMFEFVGSFLVFGFLALFGKIKNRTILYVVLGLVTFNTWFLPFVIGMVVADLYTHGYLKAIKLRFSVTLLLLGISLFLGGYPILSADGTIYQLLTISQIPLNWQMFWLTVGSTLLVLVVLVAQQLKDFFASSRVAFLGKYTFSLYLVHTAVLFTFTITTFLFLYRQIGASYNLSVLISFILSIPVVIGVTILFEKYVDTPAINLSSRFSNLLLGKEILPDLIAYKNLLVKRFLNIFNNIKK